MSTGRILIIDTCEVTASEYESTLEEAGFEVISTVCKSIFMDRLGQHDIDVAIVTHGIENEVDFMVFLKVLHPFQKILMTADYDFIRHELIAEAMGVHRYLHKPFSAEGLIESVSGLIASNEPKFSIVGEPSLVKKAG